MLTITNYTGYLKLKSDIVLAVFQWKVMRRSYRVANNCILIVKKAYTRGGYSSQKSFAEDVVKLSLSTVKTFFKGEPVAVNNFQDICEKLDLNWQEVADFEEGSETQSFQLLPINAETSPFITGAPIIEPRYFFGREKELKRLFNLLKGRPLQNAAIIGQKRSGKTSILHYLKNITTTPAAQLRSGQKSDWLPHPENYKWVFVDFQDPRLQSQQGLLQHILASLNFQAPASCALDYFMNVFSENLSSPTVILLDEIGVGLQRCPELDDTFWESLRSLATNHTRGNLAFVLSSPESPIDLAKNTGHSSPFFNIFGYTAFLGALTEAEARELIASSPIPFPDEDVEWILTQSKYKPLLLQILCRERLFTLEEGETDDSWREEGLIQMNPFTDLFDS